VSHVKGRDERTLARLVKRYGATNVVAEAHEQAGKRVKHNPPWGTGKAFRSLGPIKTIAHLRRIAKGIKMATRSDSRMYAAAEFALKFPDAVMTRPQLQRDLIDIAERYGKSNPHPRRRVVRRRVSHRRNPTLALVGANPLRGARYLGRCTEVRYVRETGAHRGRYKHPFKSRARLLALPNGSLAIVGG
jgi:hypothetical protein